MPLELVVVRVEQHQERLVDDAMAARIGRVDRIAVEEDADRFREARFPILIAHLFAVGAEPAEVDLAADLAAEEPAAAAEHRVLLAEFDQARGELEQLLVDALPVVPGDLVVLAVRVVVALLGAAHLVAADEHRYALREEERREEVPLLACAERVDLGT